MTIYMIMSLYTYMCLRLFATDVLFLNKKFKKKKNLNGWLSSFIWSKRRQKLKMATLQIPGSVAGLDLPNVREHQLCTHTRYVYDWVVNNSSSIWLGIETSLLMCPLRDLLFF